MQLLNPAKVPLTAPIGSRRPFQYSDQELVFPSPTVCFLPGEPMEVKDEDGERLLERWKYQGLVEVKRGEPLTEATERGLRARLEHFTRVLMGFRQEQAFRKAQGLELLIPKPFLRDILIEVRDLKKDLLENDPVMTEALPTFEDEAIKDPLAAELEQLGIPVGMMPMAPEGMGAMLGLDD